MHENKHNHDQHEGQEFAAKQNGPRPYWIRAHHDWRFWVAVLLMLAAMVIYVMSDDLSLRPRRQPQPSGAVGK